MSEEQKIIQELQKNIDEMQDAFRQIGDFADALRGVLGIMLDGIQEAPIVMLTLTKITELADQNL